MVFQVLDPLLTQLGPQLRELQLHPGERGLALGTGVVDLGVYRGGSDATLLPQHIRGLAGVAAKYDISVNAFCKILSKCCLTSTSITKHTHHLRSVRILQPLVHGHQRGVLLRGPPHNWNSGSALNSSIKSP